jgi:hypothetical protein
MIFVAKKTCINLNTVYGKTVEEAGTKFQGLQTHDLNWKTVK